MRRLFKVGSDRHSKGEVIFSWHPEGNFIASAGKNCVVQITDRHGDILDEISMTSNAPILDLQWDKDGDLLAILQEGNGVVPLWSLSLRRVVPLETNLRDPTFLTWSKEGPQLAIGTAKGNLLIYNKAKKQKIPVIGKHSKKISCGMWSHSGNKLVLGSDDKNVTISNDSGDTLMQSELKMIPTQTVFTNHSGSVRGPSSINEDNMVSVNLNGKSILLINIMDEYDDPYELTFAAKETGSGCRYGDIVQHQWIDDSHLLVGFSLGHLQVISTSPKEMGMEKNAGKFHNKSMTTFSFNPHMKRVAMCGDDGVRVVDLSDFKELKTDFIAREDLEDGRITNLCWSPDGQILTVGTHTGNIYNFLAKMSVLNASYKSSIAYLSSLRELSIVDAIRRSRPIEVALRLEPSIVAIGANHVAGGMNNKVYYHRIGSESDNVVKEQEYPGTVREVQLNGALAVVMTESKAHLHSIEPNSRQDEQRMQIFPQREEGAFSSITCVHLTDNFLYYGTEAGTVEAFFLNDWVMLPGIELRLDNPIKSVTPNGTSSLLVVVDVTNQVFLYNPLHGGGVNASITRFESAPQNIQTVLWDVKEKNVIMLYDGKFIHTYVYVSSSMKGTILTKLGPVSVSADGEIELNPDKVELTTGNIPIMSVGGFLTCQSPAGNLTAICHPYFDQLQTRKRRDEDSIDKVSKFCQALALLKLTVAWEAALDLDRRQFWLALSGKAMELLDIELACKVYRQLGDAGMVTALMDLTQVEDRDLLAGQISLLFCDYQRAQELFLASSCPRAALSMRRDLLQWDQALQLAKTLSARETPEICVSYGEQLESRMEVDQALNMFESALNMQNNKGDSICPDSLVNTAMMGVARCHLRSGNYRQGLRLASDIDDKQLYLDSGDILEQHKQYTEAVQMFIKCEQFERAAYIYTKHIIRSDKSKITEAARIIEKVTNNDQINSAFAKACVQAGQYEEGCRAYSRANDIDKVIELKLRHLDQVQGAFDLVRQGSSSEGALIVAEYCQEGQDFRGAIEFLLLAGKSEESFRLAQTHSLVDVYSDLLGESIGSDEALQVALYHEKQQDLGKAGKFYSLCGQYGRALKLFIQCADREIDAAIEVVGKSQNESLTHELIDFLVGEKDGVPKNPNYIYRLYMALKKFEDAAKTAIIIARQEQDMGNYTLAHSVIYETITSLEQYDIKVSSQLRQQFVLLHSYLLVKRLVKLGDHMAAAKMLLRVAQNVSKFPLHLVNILTSTVIECQRAGLKASAYEYAVQLMRPEHRSNIDVNLKKKIEAIVRRRTEKEEVPEEMSPCPISNQQISVTELECPTTRDALPMCVVTGRHIVIDDFCFCPISKSPALYSAYRKYIEAELDAARDEGREQIALDPVLSKEIKITDLTLSSSEDAKKYIQKYNNVFEEKKKKKEDDDDEDGEENNENGNDKKEKAGPSRASQQKKARASRKARK
jgi:WD repeat-containing protein 19